MNIREFSPEGPNKANAVKLCKRCPRRNDASREVYRSMVFRPYAISEDHEREYLGYDRQFFGDSGTGFTHEMPINTTLSDIDACEQPVVIRREGVFGLRKLRECGAVVCALDRYQDDLKQAQNSDD